VSDTGGGSAKREDEGSTQIEGNQERPYHDVFVHNHMAAADGGA
jgi:hypothetical protein